MECGIKNKFKGNINGIDFDEEQSYNYLKEFIEKIEDKFNLNINNKTATEFLQNQLYEETEFLYSRGDDYDEAHNVAMNSLFKDIDIIKGLLKYSKKKINI